MPKQGFQFKQFFIEHAGCAMKVGTDSIMLGSWVEAKSAQRVLDVGTGSGLLAIMIAQQAVDSCLIHGIDIDIQAVEQATKNAQTSPWKMQLSFECTSLQKISGDGKYDLIISNPPYYPINSAANKRHPNNTRVNARQTVALDHITLLTHVLKNLTINGKFYCVLPFDLALGFIDSAESNGLFCIQELQVCPKPQSPVTRVLLAFSTNKAQKITDKIIIYNELGKYSKAYISLCKEYYLNF